MKEYTDGPVAAVVGGMGKSTIGHIEGLRGSVVSCTVVNEHPLNTCDRREVNVTLAIPAVIEMQSKIKREGRFKLDKVTKKE